MAYSKEEKNCKKLACFFQLCKTIIFYQQCVVIILLFDALNALKIIDTNWMIMVFSSIMQLPWAALYAYK